MYIKSYIKRLMCSYFANKNTFPNKNSIKDLCVCKYIYQEHSDLCLRIYLCVNSTCTMLYV